MNWPWSPEISAAIQAMSAVAVLIVTGMLAWSTHRYVKLTQALVDLTRARADEATVEREHARIATINAFLALTSKFKHLLGVVAGSAGDVNDRPIRTATMWTRHDLEELQRLGAAVFVGEPHSLLVLATDSLGGILDQVESVRATSTAQGFRYDNGHFVEHWKERVVNAHYALGVLEGDADKARSEILAPKIS